MHTKKRAWNPEIKIFAWNIKEAMYLPAAGGSRQWPLKSPPFTSSGPHQNRHVFAKGRKSRLGERVSSRRQTGQSPVYGIGKPPGSCWWLSPHQQNFHTHLELSQGSRSQNQSKDLRISWSRWVLSAMVPKGHFSQQNIWSVNSEAHLN